MDIRDIFPLEVEVTKEIISKSDNTNGYRCIGANSLRKALEEKGFPNQELKWGFQKGIIRTEAGVLWLTTKEDMPFISSPTTVVFKIDKDQDGIKY